MDNQDIKNALRDLLDAVKSAIEMGDWKVDGRCDPDMAIARADKVIKDYTIVPQKTLTLKIDEQGEIELPDWIGGTSLTLAEIGAIACLGCLQAGSEVPEVMERIGTPEMAEAMQSLKAKGVLIATTDGNRASMEIDLDAVLPSSLDNGQLSSPT